MQFYIQVLQIIHCRMDMFIVASGQINNYQQKIKASFLCIHNNIYDYHTSNVQ